jgi:hypothetical protein
LVHEELENLLQPEAHRFQLGAYLNKSHLVLEFKERAERSPSHVGNIAEKTAT